MSQIEQDISGQYQAMESDVLSSSDGKKASIVDTLSGQQKVAAILVSMGKSAAAKLLKYFSPDDLRLLGGQAQKLPDITIADFDILVSQFEDSFAEGVSFSQAGERFASLVQETLPEDEAALILDPNAKVALPLESIWDIMAKMSVEELQAILANEHRQVMAYVLSKLPSDISAKILLLQSPLVRADLIRRSLHQRTVLPIIDELLDKALRPSLTSKTDVVKKVHHSQVATILNNLEKSEIEEMLDNLDGLDPEDIEKVKERLFIFDDILRLTDRARLLLFDDVASDVIITALRGADASLTAVVLAALSQRSRRMVESELASPNDSISQKDIIAARRSIAQTAIKLAEQGKISLNAENTL